jgi:hypothetical protein
LFQSRQPPYDRTQWHGALAQLVERFVRNEKVRGSIPLSSTIDRIISAPGTNPTPCLVSQSELPLS